jgi:hypothetical protein
VKRDLAPIFVTSWLLSVVCGEQHSLAEQREPGPSEQLALDHLDVVYAPFDEAGTPVHGQAVGDGVEVLLLGLLEEQQA